MLRKQNKIHFKTIIAPVLAGAVLLTVVWFEPLWAQQCRTLISPPATAQAGDTVRVMAINVGEKPVRLTISLRSADDFSVIQQSEPIFKAPDGGAFEDITLGLGLGIIATVRVEGRSRVRASLQIIDSTGQTPIFTDGFESGDCS